MSLLTKKYLSQEIILNMLTRAVRKATELKSTVHIAIVDDGGNLVGFMRTDGAVHATLQMAQDKAYTAASFGAPTSSWHKIIQEKPSLEGMYHLPRMAAIDGGVPIYYNDELIGGIGVSGAKSGEEAEEIAYYAIEILKELKVEN